jgi:hypothetical protein
MARFTTANAREMAARGLERRRQRAEERDRLPLASESNEGNAQTRLSRLWASLEVIDKRIAAELAKVRPNLGAVRGLANVARLLNAQAMELSHANGKASNRRPERVAPPDLPEPTA